MFKKQNKTKNQSPQTCLETTAGRKHRKTSESENALTSDGVLFLSSKWILFFMSMAPGRLKKKSLHLLSLLGAGDLYRAQKTERKALKEGRNTGLSVNQLTPLQKTPRQLKLRHTQQKACCAGGKKSLRGVQQWRRVAGPRNCGAPCGSFYRVGCKEDIL